MAQKLGSVNRTCVLIRGGVHSNKNAETMFEL
jgi:hypothetical protein